MSFIVCCFLNSQGAYPDNYRACNCSFLRKRYKYLLKNPSPKLQPKQDISQPRKLKIQANKGQKYNRKESMQPPVAPHWNSNGRISNGAEINTLQKKAPMFDLNQNARSLSRKDPSFLSSAPPLDLNHKDMSHSMKEPAKKSITPFFDLNQIAVNIIPTKLCLHDVLLLIFHSSKLMVSMYFGAIKCREKRRNYWLLSPLGLKNRRELHKEMRVKSSSMTSCCQFVETMGADRVGHQ